MVTIKVDVHVHGADTTQILNAIQTVSGHVQPLKGAMMAVNEQIQKFKDEVTVAFDEIAKDLQALRDKPVGSVLTQEDLDVLNGVVARATALGVDPVPTDEPPATA